MDRSVTSAPHSPDPRSVQVSVFIGSILKSFRRGGGRGGDITIPFGSAIVAMAAAIVTMAIVAAVAAVVGRSGRRRCRRNRRSCCAAAVVAVGRLEGIGGGGEDEKSVTFAWA